MAKEEKRKHTRIDSLNLSYFCLDENNQIIKQGMGRTLNVSESGILLETYFRIDSDEHLMLTIAFEDHLIPVNGRVTGRYSQEGDLAPVMHRAQHVPECIGIP